MVRLLFVLCGSPLQARQCGYRQAKVHHELPKLVDSQGFHEDVGYLQVHYDVLYVDIPNLDTLSDEVRVHLDMFRACVEHRIPSQMNTAHVVTVKGNQILDGNAQIL